jgi:hypothetical protein
MKLVAAICFASGFAGTLIGSAVLDAAAAQGHGRGAHGGSGYVVAESRFGNGVVRGAVRRTSLGPQVQLPGGSWVYCKRSCSETLRAESVDFWEARQGPGGREQGLTIYLRRW